MSFSTEWDERYEAGTHMSVWPWSDLISYVYRYGRPTGPEFRVLELGCGAGANIPFFEHLGVEYYGIEGSPHIVAQLHERFPTLRDRLVAADFTATIPFDGTFDLVVDRGSVTHNHTQAIRRCLELVHGRLRHGGVFLGFDWFSTEHSDFRCGEAAEDTHTRTGYEMGGFTGVGRVHFSDRQHLADLFSAFELEVLEHKTVRRETPLTDWRFASWNLAARKPKVGG